MKRQTSLEPTSSLQHASVSRRKSVDDVPAAAKVKGSSFGQMLDAVKTEAQLLHLWNEDMHRDLPKKWEKHGDLVILPHTCFQHPNWRMIGRRLWQIVAESLQTARLGRKRRIADDEFRAPHIDLLYGDHGWVEHMDNGVRYLYDVTQCMYSIQNASEKTRISGFDCHHETVVDLFAGIGYYTLPYLVHAGAKQVIAIDWNTDAIEALNRNLEANEVNDRCVVIEGDCRKVCPTGVADRVNMALLPTSKQYWLTGCKALKATGGILHAHGTLPIANGQVKKGKVETERVKRRERLVQLRTDSGSLGSVSEESESVDLPSQPQPTANSKPKMNGKSDVSSTKVTNGDAKVNCEQKTTALATKAIPKKVNTKEAAKNTKLAKHINGESLMTDAAIIKELLVNLIEQVTKESQPSAKESKREPIDKAGQAIGCEVPSSIDSSAAATKANNSQTPENLPKVSLEESKQQVATSSTADISSTIDTTIQAGSAATNGDTSEVPQEVNENGEKRRKFSRSASIVEEMESLLIPNPKIEKEFRREKWNSLDQSWRDLSIECATACSKYLNNIHFEKGKVWRCTVLRIGKVKPYSADIDHVVMDIDCRPVCDKLAFDDQDVE
uniref:tRNA(Phe) (4-demethylwyosine(37)-C(7)) aminocarboxypropyltransferase n=1 Tax=Plectus sambesii TaxID=2011161 RepID=A0A914W644_9BILA